VVRVTNGHVRTNNVHTIDLLRRRGFRVVNEDEVETPVAPTVSSNVVDELVAELESTVVGELEEALANVLDDAQDDDISNATPEQIDELEDVLSAILDNLEDATPNEPPVVEVDVLSESEIDAMRRGELNKYAENFAIENPADLPNKGAVIAAILAAAAEGDNTEE
jgi:hypothetical protein